jgi:copper transport protein
VGILDAIAAQPGSLRWRPIRHRWRFVVAVGIVLGVVGGLAVPASAHATLIATSPPSGAVLARPPGQIILTFDQRVEVSFGAIRVYNASEHRVDAGGATHPGGDPRAVAVSLPAGLPRGGYVVTWRVVSEDSHPVHGAFTFAIGGAGTALSAEASRLVGASSGSRTVGIVFGVVRFCEFVAVAIVVGGAVFALAIWPGARESPRARRLIWLGAGALVATTGLAFALQGPYAGALPLVRAVRPAVLTAVWHTHFGRVMVARLVLLAAAAPVLGALLRRPAAERLPPVLVAIGAALSALVLGTWGAAGHAGTGALVPIGLPFDAIHIGAASVWIGGLIMTVLVVLPASRVDTTGRGSPLRDALPRFSQWALGATIAIAVTGGFAAWQQAGSWGAVTGTPYGRLLIAKSVAFAALILLGAMSRHALDSGRATPRGRPRVVVLSAGPGAMASSPDRPLVAMLSRTVGAELAIAGVVLALTSWLVAAQPARQAYAAPFSAQVRAGPDYVDIVVDPAKAGPLAIHVYVLSPTGTELNVPEVDAQLGDPAAGITDVPVPLILAGPGHFAAYGFDVPIRGTWDLIVRVRVDSIDEYVAQLIRVPIH